KYLHSRDASPRRCARRWPVMAVDANELRTEMAGLDALETELPTQRRSLGRTIWSRTWPKLAALAIVIGLWQLVVASHWRPQFVLPGPRAVFATLISRVKTHLFWDAVARTMKRAVVGYLIAMVIGCVIGGFVATVKPLRSAFGSLITGLQTM